MAISYENQYFEFQTKIQDTRQRESTPILLKYKLVHVLDQKLKQIVT